MRDLVTKGRNWALNTLIGLMGLVLFLTIYITIRSTDTNAVIHENQMDIKDIKGSRFTSEQAEELERRLDNLEEFVGVEQ